MAEKRLVIEAQIFIAAPEGADPEEIASKMQLGLSDAVAHFPHGEVTGADVSEIRPATPEEEGTHFEE